MQLQKIANAPLLSEVEVDLTSAYQSGFAVGSVSRGLISTGANHAFNQGFLDSGARR